MTDAQLLIDIYKRYLDVTSDLVTILERNYKALENGDSEEIKQKKIEFVKHAQEVICSLDSDIHGLFKLSWELEKLEKEK